MKTSPPSPTPIDPRAPIPREPRRPRNWTRGWSGIFGKTRSLLPGLASAALVLGLMQLGTWQPLEFIAYRLMFQLRGQLPWDERVVVVAIDEPSLQAPNRYPLPRNRYTELVQWLTKAQVSTIAFDVLMIEESPDDAQLAQAIQEHARVVLATVANGAVANSAVANSAVANSAVANGAVANGAAANSAVANSAAASPNLTLAKAMTEKGHILQKQDEDGLIRSSHLTLDGVPSLAVVTAQIYSLVHEKVILPDLNQPLWINWIGAVDAAPTYSLQAVLSGLVPQTEFRDRIVLIGSTAAGTNPLVTPFDQNPPTASVYLHATILNNLLNQTALQRPGFPLVAIALLGLGASLSWGMVRWRMRQRIIVLVLATIGWIGLSVLMLRLNYWIPVAPTLALFGLTAGTVLLSDRLRENSLLQQEVDRLWQHHYQDLIVRIANDIHLLPRREFATPDLPPPRQQIAQIASLADQFARSQSAQAAIARSLSIGILAADWDGFVWFCNPVATHHLEIQVGDRLVDCLVPIWFTSDQWRICLETLQQGSQSMPYEVRSGDRWFEIRLEPLIYRLDKSTAELKHPELKHPELKHSSQYPSASTPPEGLLLILEDISNRKQIEVNLNRQMQELQRLNDLKDDFLNAVSHELRAPMANMKMAIHMLQHATASEQRNRYLHILETECAREAHLIDDLLNLQRLEAGAQSIELEPIPLQTWLPQLIEPFYERVRARQQQIVLEVPEVLPDLICDRTLLERVVVELITNACKYTPPQGEISIVVVATAYHTLFTVSNTGSEIPSTELTKIFDKFYRLPSGDRWKQGGTGLGLALVKKLLEQLGGSIQLTSQSGLTTFTAQVPNQPSITTQA